MLAELNSLAAEYVKTRAELDEARLTAQMRYDILVQIHKYAVMRGIEVPPLPDAPVLYEPGIAKRRKLAKEAALAARPPKGPGA